MPYQIQRVFRFMNAMSISDAVYAGYDGGCTHIQAPEKAKVDLERAGIPVGERQFRESRNAESGHNGVECGRVRMLGG
jgi:hypothetical protein